MFHKSETRNQISRQCASAAYLFAFRCRRGDILIAAVAHRRANHQLRLSHIFMIFGSSKEGKIFRQYTKLGDLVMYEYRVATSRSRWSRAHSKQYLASEESESSCLAQGQLMMFMRTRELLQAFMLTSSVNEGAFQQVLPRCCRIRHLVIRICAADYLLRHTLIRTGTLFIT